VNRFSVRVHPRTSKDAVCRGSDGGVEVWTRQPATDGRANDAVCRLLAAALGMPPSAVQIVAGASGRTKMVEVAGLERAEIDRRLGRLQA
jgi:uncharacterized protein YggU (UPF0235/DUF167 family)